MRDTNTHARKERRQLLGCPLPPLDAAPGVFGQAEREFLDGNRLMLLIAANELRCWPTARPFFWWERSRARRPHRGIRQDAGDIAQPQCAHTCAQVCVAAITRVHQRHATRKASLAGRSDLLKR